MEDRQDRLLGRTPVKARRIRPFFPSRVEGFILLVPNKVEGSAAEGILRCHRKSWNGYIKCDHVALIKYPEGFELILLNRALPI